jgi:hypothetical protein
VAADGGGVEAGVDAGEKDDKVFGDEIRDDLVVRGQELGFGGFPGSGQCPIHTAASLEGIWSSAVAVFGGHDENFFHSPATEMCAAIDVSDVSRDRRGVSQVHDRVRDVFDRRRRTHRRQSLHRFLRSLPVHRRALVDQRLQREMGCQLAQTAAVFFITNIIRLSS